MTHPPRPDHLRARRTAAAPHRVSTWRPLAIRAASSSLPFRSCSRSGRPRALLKDCGAAMAHLRWSGGDSSPQAIQGGTYFPLYSEVYSQIESCCLTGVVPRAPGARAGAPPSRTTLASQRSTPTAARKAPRPRCKQGRAR
jgi:hypothetical protein